MDEPGGTLRGSALDLTQMTSFAGNQEDVRLRRVAHLLDSHVYVDVGAGDPVDGSVTYWLYTQGWRGVLVEPGGRGSDLGAARPEDRVVTAAVASSGDDVVLYETSPDAGMSTMRPDRLAEVLALGQSVVQRRVPVVRLDEVFDLAQSPVSVLSVDVEGGEAEVLRSLDWDRHRPAIVVVEAVLPWSSTSTAADFEPILITAGYRRAAFDGVNAYYVDDAQEQADELTRALAYPVSLLDRWEAWTTERERRRADAAESRAVELQDRVEGLEADARQAGARLTALEREVSDARGRTASLTDELDGLRRERAALMEQRSAAQADNAHLTARLHHAEAAVRRTEERAAEAEAALHAVTSSTTWRYAAPVVHTVKGRLRFASALRVPVDLVAHGRRELSARVDKARERRMTDEARAERAVRRHTHPAFLAPATDAVVLEPPGGSTWQEAALAGRDDDDVALRRRLEARTGLRDPVQRAVQVAALAEAVAAEGKASSTTTRHRDLVVVDGRCLQDPGLATRGVGRYASEILGSLEGEGIRLLLLLDEGLPVPDGTIAGIDTTFAISSETAARTRWFIQPSPMTADAWPLTLLLSDGAIWSTTVVYDFIPSQFPACYLVEDSARLRHAARQRALSLYDEVWAISASTLQEYTSLVAEPGTSEVVWPAWVADGPDDPAVRLPPMPSTYVLIATGNEHRKNLAAAAAAVALHRRQVPGLGAVVMGWSGSVDVLRTWVEDSGLPPDSLVVLPYVSRAQAMDVRRGAAAAMVPSFAEGLSLPVIECLADGCPVVVSAIPAHMELVGAGRWAASAASPAELATALAHVAHNRAQVLEAQQRALDEHRHERLSTVVQRRWHAVRRPPTSGEQPRLRSGVRPSLGLVSPWPPQRSGIADYSAATLSPLTDRVDVTLYASSSAGSAGGFSLEPALAARRRLTKHDRLLTVVGNSHFHLPGLEIADQHGGAALCHDVRMVELNGYLGVEGGKDPLPTKAGSTTVGRGARRHPLDALPDLGFSHLARTCDLLLFHSEAIAARAAQETGASTAALPFVPYRIPEPSELSESGRAQQREARGLTRDQVHLGLFGGVDVRTKAADVVLEAVAWLRQWRVPVQLHVIGGVEPDEQAALVAQARESGVSTALRWHGHVAEVDYRGWLTSVDLGVQLRSAALLSLSGAAADLAAYGVPTVATAAMVQDMGLPAYVRTVPDDFSPLLVAEALAETWEALPLSRGDEAQRLTYLQDHSTAVYGDALLTALGLETR